MATSLERWGKESLINNLRPNILPFGENLVKIFSLFFSEKIKKKIKKKH